MNAMSDMSCRSGTAAPPIAPVGTSGLADVAAFCREHGRGRAFGWEGLEGLLEWYAGQGMLVVARSGRRVVAVAMVWRTTEARIRELERRLQQNQ